MKSESPRLGTSGTAAGLGQRALATWLVLLLTLSALAPLAMSAGESRADPAPDLSIDPTSVDVEPRPLVQGVLVNVHFTLWNRGEQNAYGIEVLLDVDGTTVNMQTVSGLAINESTMLSLNWTPTRDGVNTLTLVSWYGAGSQKLDQNWANNNYTWTENVESRPNAQVTTADIQILLGATPDPEYIRDGDTLTIRATVRNLGTSDITACDVSLWETAGRGGPRFIEEQSAVTVGGTSSSVVTFYWNTTNWAGKRNLVVNVTGVEPAETDLTNNRASKAVKIHTKEDLFFSGTDSEVVDTEYKVNFFINLEDDASLTIVDTGNMTIYQDFDEQFDIVVQDRATLTVDGGLLKSRSDLNFTVYLYQSAKLFIEDGANTNIRVITSGAATVVVDGSNVSCPSVSMTGGSLTLNEAKLTTARLTLTNTALDVSSSEILLGEPLVISGRSTTIRDSSIVVRRVYEGFPDAVIVHPELETFDPDSRRVEGLPPALVATSGANVDLINVSVESTVYTESDQVTYWTENRLGATGTASVINIKRYLTVTVVEWSGEVVIGAHVQVLDYFTDDVKTETITDDVGVAVLVVMTDYIKETLKPFVGNLRVRADLDEQHSEYVRFSHNKYPNMDFTYNDMDITIVLPPSGTPDTDPKTLFIRSDQTLSGSIDRSIVIDNAVVTVEDSELMLEQDFAFQWFIIVRGQRGALLFDNASLGSAHTFVIFLEGNARLVLGGGSDAFNTRVVAYDQSVVNIQASDFTGDIYARCLEVGIVTSNLEVIDTLLDATKVTVDGTVMVEKGFHVRGHQVDVRNADLTNQYEMSKAVGVRDLRRFVSIYGWDILEASNVTENPSYFKEFMEGVNITIEADLLDMDNAFLYADEVNIIVARNAGAEQTQLVDTWVGADELVIVSDDLVADGCAFNSVLDDLTGTDHWRLYSSHFPAIVCSESATAERYWYLTVHGVDGAGSIRPGAWLEVVSTETNQTLVDNERTTSTGAVTVPILANTTDRTGDYFVGSIMFRLRYDESEFSGNPTYTPWVRIAMKSDFERTGRFPETIQSPKKDIEYVIHNLTEAGTIKDLRYFGSTFKTTEDAWEFYNETHEARANRLRPWDVIRGTQAQITLHVSSRINNVWRDLENGEVTLFIVNMTKFPNNQTGFTPTFADRHINYNGKELVWKVWPDAVGLYELTGDLPDSTGSFMLMVEISGGAFDPEIQLITNRTWSFTVLEPQNIEIFDANIVPRVVEVGQPLTLSGVVRYIALQTGVNSAELTISGQSIQQQTTLTGEAGVFSITIQAPFIAADNYTLTISAVDPATEQRATITLSYRVELPITDIETGETNWGWVYAIIIAGVLAAAIGGGFVIFLRRQWGKLVECGECGAFIPASSPKCPKCGVEFETDLARCSECEAWIPADSPSCPVCGTPFTIEVLERQAVAEEAVEQGKPIEQVTMSSAKLPPIPLASATPGPDIEPDRTRRTRIKKRVKKRLTVAEADLALDSGVPEEASDLFVGGPEAAAGETRLPGIDIGEDTLSEDELSKLLPTEDMLKELMLTTDKGTEKPAEGEEPAEGAAPASAEETMDLGLEEVPTDEDLAGPESRGGELEEIPQPGKKAEPSLDRLPLSGPVMVAEKPGVSKLGEDLGEDDGLLLKELGIKPSAPTKKPPTKGKVLPKGKGVALEDRGRDEEAADDGLLGDILTEPKEREAPKLCPNCGGNWILYKGGEYTCRICGEKW